MVLGNRIKGGLIPFTRSTWGETSKAFVDRNYRIVR